MAGQGWEGGQSAYTLWRGSCEGVHHALALGQELLEPPCQSLQERERELRTSVGAARGDIERAEMAAGADMQGMCV